MKGKLYIVSAPRFIFDGLTPGRQERIVYLPDFLSFPKTRFKQLTRALLVGRIHLPKKILYTWFQKEYLDQMLQAKAGDAILIYEGCNVNVLKAIRSLIPSGVTCHIYYCNPIHTTFKNPSEDLKKIQRLGYELSTFDPKDAERYNIKFANQYFRYPAEDIPEEPTSDCFFCGLAKNRIHELQALKELLETNALTCNFIIPETAKEGISYAEYLKQLSLSRCVIDINQSNQTGLTRRPLEALFYNKKLITNNADIRRYNFYNPKNIFIFWG